MTSHAPYHEQALAFIQGRTDSFTRHDLQTALGIDMSRASIAVKKLVKDGLIEPTGKGASTAYLITSGPMPARKPTQKSQTLVKVPENSKREPTYPVPLMSAEAENAIQTFTSALAQLENLRNENERMKHALTQILTIASNALLK